MSSTSHSQRLEKGFMTVGALLVVAAYGFLSVMIWTELEYMAVFSFLAFGGVALLVAGFLLSRSSESALYGVGEGRVQLSNRVGYLAAFLMCAGLRVVPEVLSFPYPIGFDAVQYAQAMELDEMRFEFACVVERLTLVTGSRTLSEPVWALARLA